MRKSNINTLKKAHQTVYFLNLLSRTTAAIFLQLPSNTHESLLKLTVHLKKLGFFVSTSLVKNHETPDIFKCTTVVASDTYKNCSEIQTCVKQIQILYPTAVIFFIKDNSQLYTVEQLNTLVSFESLSYRTINVDSLLSTFSSSVLLLPQHLTYDLLSWLSNRDTLTNNSTLSI